MRQGIRVLKLYSIALALIAFAQVLEAQTKPVPSNWILTFAEEFNGTELEFPKWTAHDPWGRERPREVAAYVPEAAVVGEGLLRITAKKEHARYAGHEREYTSGFVATWGSFAQTYGKFEIRCRMPVGKGLEPKFWLVPLSGGEVPSVDVFDAIGSEPTRALFATRWGDEQTERSYSGGWPGPDLSRDFHTFAVEWDEAKIVWFIDGRERFRATEGVPHQPLCLAVNLAVGGLQARYPDNSTRFPAVFEVDYVRVYRKP